MSLAVFCGSSLGASPAYAAAAARLGGLLADRGVRLVYGGAAVGLMGVVADAVLSAGGAVTGVIPGHLQTGEVPHRGLADLRVVGSMHERKAMMAELADGFVALPGGLGTLDELFEILTWQQLRLHEKPVGLLDVAGFFGRLLAVVDQCVAQGFVPQASRDRLLVDSEPGRLVDRLWASTAPRSDAGGDIDVSAGA